MALTTNTSVAVVNEDHTVLLPVDVPVEIQVAIVLLPEASQSEGNADRQARFARVMAAIRDAQASNYLAPEISDAELDERIDRAQGISQHPDWMRLLPPQDITYARYASLTISVPPA